MEMQSEKVKKFENISAELFSNWINGNKKDCLAILLSCNNKIESMALSADLLYELLKFDNVNKSSYGSSFSDYMRQMYMSV